jgi:hypothetical protein
MEGGLASPKNLKGTGRAKRMGLTLQERWSERMERSEHVKRLVKGLK